MAQTIVIFDLDRTITRFGTFTPYLLFAAKKRPWRLALLPVTIISMLLYVCRFISRKRLKEFMIFCFLSGLHKETIDDISAKFVDRLLGTGCYKDAIEAVVRHKAAGDYIVIATASMDFYVRVISERLGFDRMVATGSVWDNRGRIVSKIAEENCYGHEKLTKVKECLANIMQSDGVYDVMAYTDHHSDQPLLEWATVPVAVNPTPKLKRLAHTQKWGCVNWQ